MENERKITLIIEASDDNGVGVSVLIDGAKTNCGRRTNAILKAEDILIEISNLFEENGYRRKDIKQIKYAVDSGSSTAIKICLAIAKGLGKAAGCESIATIVTIQVALLIG